MPADSRADASSALEPLRESPERSAVLTDIDGTLAPIAELPGDARVPEEARRALAALSRRYALVGCVSGRPALEAREMVGVSGIVYAGNHGLELLGPGEEEARLDPSLGSSAEAAARFVASLDHGRLAAAGIRLEDKGPIQALHWRGAPDEEGAARLAGEIAAASDAEPALEPRWGRKVLEVRPAGLGGKDAAVEALIATAGDRVSAAVYAGDDRTDLDAFRQLREMRASGRLALAVCVGIVSAEGPPEIGDESDLSVAGPGDWLTILRSLEG